jgi:hypothetical protein
MYVSNPTWGLITGASFVQRELICNVSDVDVPLVRSLLHCLRLVTVLRNLQEPLDGSLFDAPVAKGLMEAIAAGLDEAAASTSDRPTSLGIQARAQSFRDGTYQAAATIAAATDHPRVELILGQMPSWRFPGHARLYTGILAIPCTENTDIDQPLITCAERLVRNLNRQYGAAYQLQAPPPVLQIADLLATAGDALCHPLHVANFLPDDEGVRNATARRTVIYRNLYKQRFEDVSVPLYQRVYDSRAAAQIPEAGASWVHLIAWFRGHDLGHIYFDTLCCSVRGLSRYHRYVLQESLADVFGILVALEVAREGGRPATEPIAVYLAEMLRYMRREISLYPDAAAASLQLNSLIKSGALRLVAGHLEIPDPTILSESLISMLSGLLRIVHQRDGSIAERIIEYRSGLSEGGMAFPPWLLERLGPPVEITDVDALYTTADLLCAGGARYDSKPRSRGIRESDLHCMHRH